MTAATALPDPPADRDVAPDRGAAGHAGAATIGSATVTADGVDFCVYAKRATGVELLLFDGVDDDRPGTDRRPRPARATGPAPTGTSTCRGIGAGQLYGFRATGRGRPSGGLRFDATKVLLDPYGRASRRRRATAGSTPARRPMRRRR